MKFGLILPLFLISFCVQGQKDPVRYKYAQSITPEDLKERLTVLSSDEFMGRETGTEGQRKAEQYLVDRFKDFGLKPGNKGSYVQNYSVFTSRPDALLTLDGTTYTFLSEFYFYNKYKKDIEANAIVFAGYGIDTKRYSDYKNIDVKGKLVLILEDEPKDKQGKSLVTGTEEVSEEWSYNWRKKYETALSKGAIGIITVVKDFTNKKKLVKSYLSSSKLFLDKGDGMDGSSDEPPAIYVSEELANTLLLQTETDVDAIKKRIQQKGKTEHYELSVKLSIDFLPNGDRLQASNVLAFIEGTEKKDEVVVITAHYDHLGQRGDLIFNGADDDGSGTVALLEIAQAFAIARDSGYAPKRSILFMPVSGEEKGLLGSEYYSRNPVYPIINTIADLNIDMIGRHDSLHSHSNYVYVIGSDRLSTDLHNINEEMNRVYTGLDFDYTYNEEDDPNQFYYRSDHYNFAKHGIPSIFFFSGVHEDYHKPTDTVDKIEFEKMTTITRLVFYTAWELANREKAIVVDKPIDWD